MCHHHFVNCKSIHMQSIVKINLIYTHTMICVDASGHISFKKRRKGNSWIYHDNQIHHSMWLILVLLEYYVYVVYRTSILCSKHGLHFICSSLSKRNTLIREYTGLCHHRNVPFLRAQNLGLWLSTNFVWTHPIFGTNSPWPDCE